MNTTTKKLDKCQVELTVTVDAEEMKAIVKDVEKAFVREVQIPGFRKGKVPLEMIRRDYAKGIEEETGRAMIQKNMYKAVEAEKLDMVAVADVKDVTHTAEGGTFTAIVEVKPEFKCPEYKGLKIEKKDVKVTDEQVNDRLDALRKAYAKYEDAKEGETVGEGDFVQIDYSGTVDGKSILEIAPDAKVVAEGNGFWTQVEDGRFLPEILEAVKGMKIGETKEGIKAEFDKESAPEALKGAKAEYKLTLKAFRRRIIPGDAEFIAAAKAESLEKFSASIRESMQKMADDQEKARLENEVVEGLLARAEFEVPASQVRRATDNYLQQLAQRAQYSGISAEYFEKNREQIMKDADEAAKKQVRLWYIIDAIAAEEKLEVKDEEKGAKVIELVLANAK